MHTRIQAWVLCFLLSSVALPVAAMLQHAKRHPSASAKQAQLEPAYDRQFITLHVDTEEYAIGKNAAATRAFLHEHPVDGRLYTRKIGNEPEYGLAARILASRMRKAEGK